MARTMKRNPWLVSGDVYPVPVRATDSKKRLAGQFGLYAAAGTVEPMATDGTKVNVQFLQDQTTSTDSTDVWVHVIQASDEFEGFVSTDDEDATATVANVGNDYGITNTGTDYYNTVNTNETTNVAVTVTDYAARYNPLTDNTSDSPGKVRFRFKASVLDAS